MSDINILCVTAYRITTLSAWIVEIVFRFLLTVDYDDPDTETDDDFTRTVNSKIELRVITNKMTAKAN